MAFTLKLSSLTLEERRSILKKFSVKPEKTEYNPNPPTYRCFKADKKTDTLYLPYGMWRSYVDKSLGFPNGDSKHFPKMNKNAKFIKKLYTPDNDPTGRKRDQQPVVDEALRKLKGRGYVFLELYTGMGKTALAIYLSIALKLKTVILCFFDTVRRQWPDEYDSFSGGSVKVQFVEGAKVKLDPTADVYIIGIQKAINMDASEFICIGTVIVDETQKKTIAAFTECLLKFAPRYLIGLSATPDRKDGMHCLYNFYYGKTSSFIIRKEKKDFTVYKYKTKYVPTVKYVMRKGRMVPDWNEIISSIESNEERWKEIASIAVKHANEKIIILCKRKVSTRGIYNLLIEMGEDVEILIENMKTWNKNARILVSIVDKGGVGMNDSKLTMAILASDYTDVRQYEGRIRTNNNIIYHIVDNYKTFETHYEKCEPFYIEKGGVIKLIDTRPNSHANKSQSTKRYLPVNHST